MKKLVIGALATMGLAAAAPAVAQAPAVNLAISRVGAGPQGTTTTVQYGELVRISGEINRPQANQPVELTVTPYRGETRTVSLRTDAEGEFAWTHRPTIRTGYTARWGTQPSSQEPYAHVRPKVGLRALQPYAGRTRRFRVTMMAQPEHVSRVVVIQRQLGPNRWLRAKRVQLRGSNLSATFSLRLPRGVQRVRVFVPQTPGYLKTWSQHVRVVVR